MQEQNEQDVVKEPKSPLTFLVDSMLSIENTRIRTQVRDSHLKRRKVVDPRTEQVLQLLESAEETVDGWVAEELHKHPAYPWFSRIKGIGDENIAKVVGPIDIRKARMISSLWKYAGMHVINREVSTEEQFEEVQISIESLQVKLDQLRKKAERKAAKGEAEEETETVMTPSVVNEIIGKIGIRLESPDKPVNRGYAPTRSMYKEEKKKLDYNSGLRVMCFRLAGSLLKARGKYAEFYDKEKRKLVSKYREKDVRIIPTLELPTKTGRNGRKVIFEPVGTIASNHVHMQAMRKMIKLFLSHLWLVWREAEELPITKPYAYDVLKHTEHDYIGPWEMVEKPERTHRAKRSQQLEASL